MNVTTEQLKKAGFVETRYKNQEGIFLTKKIIAKDFPYAVRHLIDDDLVYPQDILTLEVTPDNTVQYIVAGTDVFESKISMDSEDARVLLADAGVELA